MIRDLKWKSCGTFIGRFIYTVRSIFRIAILLNINQETILLYKHVFRFLTYDICAVYTIHIYGILWSCEWNSRNIGVVYIINLCGFRYYRNVGGTRAGINIITVAVFIFDQLDSKQLGSSRCSYRITVVRSKELTSVHTERHCPISFQNDRKF